MQYVTLNNWDTTWIHYQSNLFGCLINTMKYCHLILKYSEHNGKSMIISEVVVAGTGSIWSRSTYCMRRWSASILSISSLTKDMLFLFFFPIYLPNFQQQILYCSSTVGLVFWRDSQPALTLHYQKHFVI